MGRPRIEDPGYGGIHWRLNRDRGRAHEHACEDCEAPARQWALHHEAPTLRDYRGVYSLSLSDYSPLCTRCHRRYDSEGVAWKSACRKLTEDDVRDIRDRHARGESQRTIARAHEVGRSTVRNILDGRTWTHVPS